MGASAKRVRTAIFTAAMLVPAVAVSGVPVATAAGPGPDPWIDTNDRGAVLEAYRAEFERTEPAIGFTGDTASCQPGSTSAEFRQSVIQRINWYRRMAGLDVVADRADYNSDAQQSALMMSAEGSLSHYPGPSWACHTAGGETAAGKSNLALGTNGTSAIDAYIQDSGLNNLEMGHRRTIFYPQLLEVGTGDVPAGPGTWAANTLRVFDDNLWGTRPEVRQPEGFVAWPPAGYVPPQAVWGRWTFSLYGGDFTNATVTVSDESGPVPTTVLARRQATTPTGRIAPEPTIVWAVGPDNGSALMPVPTAGDSCYEIIVDGVSVSGVLQPPFAYTSCVIDPTFVMSSVAPTVPGAATATVPCVNTQYSSWTKPCWSAGAANSGFLDVVQPWQTGPVNWLVSNGITAGVTNTSFDPDGVLTRAQAATLIWRLAGSPPPPADAPDFDDVEVGAYYRQAVRWMAANGITMGTGPNRFSPGDQATRAQLVTFLWRLVDSPANTGSTPFTDLSAGWQHQPVQWAATTGITMGTSNTTFTPDKPVSRGEVAAFLARFAAAISG